MRGCVSRSRIHPLLTRTMRKRLLHTLTETADRADPSQQNVEIPLYPDAVPDIDQHIEDLAELIHRVDPHGTRMPSEMQQRICAVCPHQFPETYCPLRPHGGCRLYRLAAPISAALAADMEIADSVQGLQERLEPRHGNDAR